MENGKEEMTKEQLEKLYIIGKQIQEICPDVYGSVKFNLRPGRESVNINLVVEESKILINPNK